VFALVRMFKATGIQPDLVRVPCSELVEVELAILVSPQHAG